MSEPNRYNYQGEMLTIAQLAKIRGCGKTHMRALVHKFGAEAAMTYQPKRDDSRYKNYEYDGQKYTIKQLCAMAWVKCSPQAMGRRIEKYGVKFSVECDDFQALRAQQISDKAFNKKMGGFSPTLPEYNPEQHILDNMTNSLREQGLTENEIYNEIKRRIAA